MNVNGVQIKLGQQISLEQFLRNQGFTLTRVAVELNGDIVPKSTYSQLMLSDVDRMEIVHFVGGG